MKEIRGVLWCLTRKGIFYFTRDAAGDAIQLYQPDAGSETVGKLNFRISGHASHMSVSEDGRWLITGEVNRNESVLMWIDNFR